MSICRSLGAIAALVAVCFAKPAAAARPDIDVVRPRTEKSAEHTTTTKHEVSPAPDTSDSLPPGYHYEERPRTVQLWTGALLFGAAWIADAAVGVHLAMCEDSEEDKRSDTRHCPGALLGAIYAVPIWGPGWLGVENLADSGWDSWTWFSLATSAAQLVGTTLWLSAAAMGPRRVLVRNNESTAIPATVIVPVILGTRGVGLSMSAAF